jgi:hypothetical protein
MEPNISTLLLLKYVVYFKIVSDSVYISPKDRVLINNELKRTWMEYVLSCE